MIWTAQKLLRFELRHTNDVSGIYSVVASKSFCVTCLQVTGDFPVASELYLYQGRILAQHTSKR